MFYLLFSGMTRARKKLFLTYRKSLLSVDYKTEKVSPSRFLSLLPDDITVSEYNPYKEYKKKKTVKRKIRNDEK